MNYFSQFLKAAVPIIPKTVFDDVGEFNNAWHTIRETLEYPDERQLARGIASTDVPACLKSMVDSLIWESTRTEEGTAGGCLEYLLKNDVLGTLVRLSAPDRPSGIQAEVLRAISNMVVLLDEQFLVHTAVHRPILQLLRTCVGDELLESIDGRGRLMGAAGSTIKPQPSQYEEDLVDLLCTLCSRIRTYRELLMIFFHDKHWYRTQNLTTIEELADLDEDVDESGGDMKDVEVFHRMARNPSPTLSQDTITDSNHTRSSRPKPEYEFLLFNYLLRFVHREGRIGDFARAGMLFLMDVAMSAGVPPHHFDGEKVADTEDGQDDPVADAALALTEYILEGDFSEVLGAGLSAVYSLLPTKLRLEAFHRALDGIPLSGISPGLFSDDAEWEQVEPFTLGIGIESSSSVEFRSKLDHFLTMMEFIQDVMARNVKSNVPETSLVGSAIVDSVLDAVRRIFLENVVYPSILECSDVDGSSVAVMSYLDAAFRTLKDGPLTDLLLHFLLSEGEDGVEISRIRKHKSIIFGQAQKRQESAKDAKMRRRKSTAMMFLEMEAPDAQKESTYVKDFGRFTLKDLISANMNSSNTQSAAAACQLFRTLLQGHCSVVVNQLITVKNDNFATSHAVLHRFYNDILETPLHNGEDEENFVYPGYTPSVTHQNSYPELPSVTYPTHVQELEMYLDLASRISSGQTKHVFSTGYDHYLQDSIYQLSNQNCFAHNAKEGLKSHGHVLNAQDPMLKNLVHSLCQFYARKPEYNVALTGAIASVALCPYRSLAGWLTLDLSDDSSVSQPIEYEMGVLLSGEDDRSIDYTMSSGQLHAANVNDRTRPILHVILWNLVVQLERYRQTIPDFDGYLEERRQGLLFSENLQDAMDPSLDSGSPPSSASPRRDHRSPSVPYEEYTPRHRQKRSVIMALLSPTKRSTTKRTPLGQESPSSFDKAAGDAVASSPFAQHYHATRILTVEVLEVPMPQRGPWAPTKKQKWTVDEEEALASDRHWNRQGSTGTEKEAEEESEGEMKRGAETISLSRLLDNVVVLEECIKELAAIIEARRCIGIDVIRHV